MKTPQVNSERAGSAEAARGHHSMNAELTMCFHFEYVATR